MNEFDTYRKELQENVTGHASELSKDAHAWSHDAASGPANPQKGEALRKHNDNHYMAARAHEAAHEAHKRAFQGGASLHAREYHRMMMLHHHEMKKWHDSEMD